MLTKDSILQAEDLPRTKVAVPEWGGDLWVRTLRGDELEAYQARLQTAMGPDNKLEGTAGVMRYLVILSLCDEDGVRVFSDDDEHALGQKSAKVLNRLFAASAALNGVTKEDVEDLAKN